MNLSVKKGEFLVICGPSGGGKSTLLRHIKPALTPHGTKSGAVLFNGKDINEYDEKETAAKIGFVMQSPEHQIVTDKVWHELAFGLESLGKDSDTIRRRTAEMAAFFGIENIYHNDTAALSGGQKQLLCLASVLACEPELIILDEPTAQLDPIAASEFLSALGKINRELGTTIILSEHRLEEAFALADRTAVIEKGRILFTGTPEETGKFLKVNRNSMFSAMPASMRIWGATENELPCPVTVNNGREFVREYLKTNTINELHKKEYGTKTGRIVLSVNKAWFRYEKDEPDVIRGLDITAKQGEMLCILGGNGSGKTTALKLLCGIKKAYRGEVKTDGLTVLLPQDPEILFVKNTVYEDLEDMLKQKNLSRQEREHRISEISALCEINTLLGRHPYDLSGGEKQRAALAKVLLISPDILLLDEPTKGLDVPFKEKLAEIIAKLKNSGVCIITVSHDTDFCAKYADRCAMFFDGEITSEGTPEEFFSSNSFYTTAANRIIREAQPRAVTTEDVIEVLGGRNEEKPVITESAPTFEIIREEKPLKKKLPLWRKICAAITAAAAFGIFIYTSNNEIVSNLVSPEGLTSSGIKQLIRYGILILLLFCSALFLGRKSAPSVTIQTPVQKRKISERTAVASALILLAVPLTLFIGTVYLTKKQYYLTAVLVLIECMLPFFLIFEGRKPKAREIVTTASLTAIAVAGRAVFFMLPEFKPVMAVTIIAGVALGAETGFLTGALSMFISNMLFSQGPWTPFQMFAMGIIGFLAGILYKKGLLVRSAGSLAVFGAVCAILIYGGIMNPTSLLIWGGENINAQLIMSYYVTGFPVDAVHAAATALFLWFGAEPVIEILDRLKTKYGIDE